MFEVMCGVELSEAVANGIPTSIRKIIPKMGKVKIAGNNAFGLT